MSAPDTVTINTLEQILSTDLNRIGGLAGKAVQDALARLESGIADLTPRSVVRNGLLTSPGTGLAINLTAGELMTFDAGTSGADVSSYLFGRLETDASVGGFTPDGVNPRIVLVHGTPITTNSDSQTRNILTLPSRIVTPTLVFKSARPDLTVALTHGIPDPNPVAPATPGGAVPLWYVYLPANATAIDDDSLADARVRFHPSGLSRAHTRTHGLYADTSGTPRDDVQIVSGRGWVNGAELNVASNVVHVATDLFGSGSGFLVGDSEYTLYAVAKGGPGHIVGKNVADDYVPVLVLGNPPNADGRPSVALTYRPLFGTGIDNWTETTIDALYLGTLHTDVGAEFQIGGDGTPLNHDGSSMDLLARPNTTTGGIPGAANGWLRPPVLAFNNVTTVSVGICFPMIQGVPGQFGGGTVSLPGDLVSGDVESASTFYYVYLRPRLVAVARGTIRHYQLVISSEGPNVIGGKPTPETGFLSSEYLFCGSFFNDAGSDILQYRRNGNHVLWFDDITVADFDPVALSPSRSTVTTKTPATSRMVIVYFLRFFQSAAGGAVQSQIDIFAELGVTPRFARMARTWLAAAGTESDDSEAGHYTIPVDASGEFELSTILEVNFDIGGGAREVVVRQNGYLEDVQALP